MNCTVPRHLAARAAAVSFLLAFVARAAGAAVSVPPGFRADIVAEGPELSFVTGLAFDGDGVLHVCEADLFRNRGRVLRLADRDGDGRAETVTEFASGFGLATGITFRVPVAPRGAGKAKSPSSLGELEDIRLGRHRGEHLDLLVAHFVPGPGGGGSVSRVRDADGDGVADERTDLIVGLPSDGVNGNQQIAIGPDHRLYFGQGARTNSGVPGSGPADGPLSGTILRAEPDGSGLAVHARGLRNVYDLVFLPDGELLATENGPDASGPRPIVGAPDELNAIEPGGHYGWPDSFGFPPEGTGTLGPIATFGPGTSTDGIALMTAPFGGFGGDLFAAQFGSFTDPSVGRRLVRIHFEGRRALRVDVFATGFGRPLDVAVGPDGALYVADFSNAFFAPRTAVIYRIRPE